MVFKNLSTKNEGAAKHPGCQHENHCFLPVWFANTALRVPLALKGFLPIF